MKTPFSILFASLLLFLLSGCATSEDPPVSYAYVQMSPKEPPRPLPENAFLSTPSEYWRQGHWAYDGYNFTWIPGSFILRPSPSAVWAGDKWLQRNYGWAFVPGHWQ